MSVKNLAGKCKKMAFSCDGNNIHTIECVFMITSTFLIAVYSEANRSFLMLLYRWHAFLY